MRFLVLLVKKFAVIHQLADRRNCVRRDFHEVDAGLASRFHGVEKRHHAKLIASFVHNTDFTGSECVRLPEVPEWSTTFSDNHTLPGARDCCS